MVNIVKAPHGTELTCRGWQQEAALRMLMNNLDPDVAERPQDLNLNSGSPRRVAYQFFSKSNSSYL